MADQEDDPGYGKEFFKRMFVKWKWWIGLITGGAFVAALFVDFQQLPVPAGATQLVLFVTALALIGWASVSVHRDIVKEKDKRIEELTGPDEQDVKVNFKQGAPYRTFVTLEEFEKEIDNINNRKEDAKSELGDLVDKLKSTGKEEQVSEFERKIDDTVRELDQERGAVIDRLRKGKVRVKFQIVICNLGGRVVKIIDVNRKRCRGIVNDLNYSPMKVELQRQRGTELPAEIKAGEHVVIACSMDVDPLWGNSFHGFVADIAGVHEEDEDCFQFELRFQGEQNQFTKEVMKKFSLEPVRDEFVRHWLDKRNKDALEILDMPPVPGNTEFVNELFSRN